MDGLAKLLLLVAVGLLIAIYFRLGRLEAALGKRKPPPQRLPGRGKLIAWPPRSNQPHARRPPDHP